MQPRELLQIMTVAERLKDTTRHCFTSGGRHESVAEHSWRAALMAYLLEDEFLEADMNKVIRMCLIHDLGECFTGDIASFNKTAADEEKEDRLLHNWLSSLPKTVGDDMKALFSEIAERKTTEAKLFKAIDGLEAVIQHNESDLSTWQPNEYSLNLVYAEDKVAFSPYLTALRTEIRKETEEKLRANT